MKKWKNLFINNWVLKLISLAIAFVLWFVVICVDDPVDEKTFNNIKVNLVNTELLTDKNMVYEVLEGTDVLKTVTFEAPNSIREKIETGDIIAEADLNDLTVTNTVAITFSCPKYSQDVTNISGNISYVKLDIEEKASKWIDIKYNLIGDVADGYIINNISLDQNRLEIEGPASKIAEVSRAVVDVNVSGISYGISTQVDVHLKNEDGAELNYTNITKSIDRVKVDVGVYATKEVPVEYQIMGEPADGYQMTGVVDATPQTVLIAGTNSALSSVSKLVVPAEALDVTDAAENFEGVINLRQYLTNGITFADKEFDGKAYVTVYIEKIIERELDLEESDLNIINKPENMIVSYPADVQLPTLTISGLEEYVAAVDTGGLVGTVDVAVWMEEEGLETLTSGTYQLPVSFELPENVEQVETVTVTVEFITPEELAARTLAKEPEEE